MMKKKANRSPLRSNQQLRTRKDLLAAASRLMEAGRLPSMDEIAREALVSRPTAYRYFPSVDALLHEAALEESMPEFDAVLERMPGMGLEERVLAAESSMHRYCHANEARLRILLANSLSRDPGENNEVPVRQNRRLPLIEAALEPARKQLTPANYRKLCSALALIFGTESMIVFRDVLRVDEATARNVKTWAIRALLRSALQEKAGGH